MRTYVTLTSQADIATLTFAAADPAKPATLDYASLDDLATRLDEIEVNLAAYRAVVVQAASEKYFIVGANVNALQTINAETIGPWIEKGHTVFNRLETLPLPVVARVEGFALGGGLELAMACDLIVASERAKLGQPEARLGFVAGWGGTYRLPRRVGLARAKELFFTGKILEARAALEIGLVDFVGDVDGYLESFFADLRAGSALAVAEMKRLVNATPTMTVQDSLIQETVSSIRCVASGDAKFRVAAFLESRRKK